MFVYKLSGCGFESSSSHLNIKLRFHTLYKIYVQCLKKKHFFSSWNQASQPEYLLATLMLIEKMDIGKPKREEKTEIE